MSKNSWIYVTGGLVMLSTIILGLVIPHQAVGLYGLALGILVLSEVVFFFQMVVKRAFTDWLPLNVVTVVWMLLQVLMLYGVQVLSGVLFWIIEVILFAVVAIIASLTASDSLYRKGRSEAFAARADEVFQPKKGDY